LGLSRYLGVGYNSGVDESDLRITRNGKWVCKKIILIYVLWRSLAQNDGTRLAWPHSTDPVTLCQTAPPNVNHFHPPPSTLLGAENPTLAHDLVPPTHYLLEYRKDFGDSPSQEEVDCLVDAVLTGEGVKRGMTHVG